MAGALTWLKEQTRVAVNVVPPNQLVRVLAPGPMPSSGRIDVYSLPEWAVARIVYKLTGRLSKFTTSLPVDSRFSPDVGPGVLSAAWQAAHFGLEPAATRHIAKADGFSRSAVL